jgi:hypothetical protein
VDSHLYRSMHPDEAGWTLTNHLLATIADVLRWLQWAKTKDGQKNRNRPEPITRPGVKSSKKRTHPKVKGVPLSRMRALLNQGREALPDRATQLRNLFQTGKAV